MFTATIPTMYMGLRSFSRLQVLLLIARFIPSVKFGIYGGN